MKPAIRAGKIWGKCSLVLLPVSTLGTIFSILAIIQAYAKHLHTLALILTVTGVVSHFQREGSSSEVLASSVKHLARKE